MCLKLVTLSAVLLSWFSLLLCSSCPNIIPRADWNASAPTLVENLTVNPPPYVVVHHSATEGCTSEDQCKKLVHSIQSYHMNVNHWEDIGYNFLIGGEGSILEGRGWGVHGAHAPPYNSRSMGICLLGNFMGVSPSDVQMEALKKLIECGVELDNIAGNYSLIGHRQVSATLCPGDLLYRNIRKWSHFQPNPTNKL